MLLPSVPLDAIRQPAFVYAAEGRIVAANSPIQALAGRSLAGCTATDILATFRNRHPDGTPFLPHELPLSRALRDEKTVDVPMTITAADGREHHLLVSASPLRDGGRITAALVVWQDVTGIRRAEEALAESEDLFRRTFDQSPVASSLLLPDSTLLRANTALCQMLGYSEAELQRMLFPELTHPDDVDEDCGWPPNSPPARSTSTELDKRFIRKDGAVVWGHLSVRYVRDAAGRVMYLLPMVQDITERKQAEAALRESEAKYRRFVDDDITGQFISAPDGRLLDCNPAFARMFGFASVEEARSASVIDTYDAPSEREPLLDRLRRERRLENEERFRRRRDGTQIHVVENIIGDFDEGGEPRPDPGLHARRYAAVPGRGGPAGAGADPAGDLPGRPRRHRHGLAPDDHPGQRPALPHDRLYPRRTDRPGRADASTRATRRTSTSGGRSTRRSMADGVGAVETQWRRKDGAIRDILLSSSPIDLSRPHEDVVFNALDITRLRESERALESYMDDLQRSNEELQRFAYVASHDLQEPLRSIISFSQLLERRYQGKLDADADEYIEFIVEGGNRMQRLIEDLLQLSRVETKARPLAPTDAGEVVADALRLMETSIREAGATVTVGRRCRRSWPTRPSSRRSSRTWSATP